MAGLVPAILILMATRCARNRDARDKRGHDVERAVDLIRKNRFLHRIKSGAGNFGFLV